MQKLVILLFALALSACSSIPLGTMIKMASMDRADITAIEPTQIRSRITVDTPTQLQTTQVRLALRFEFYGNSGSEYEFLLKLESDQAVNQKKNWYSGAIDRFEYVFVLADESIVEFKKYQRDFFKYGKPKRYHWVVYYSLKNRPPAGETSNLDLELKLSDDDPYFYLLKDASMENG